MSEYSQLGAAYDTPASDPEVARATSSTGGKGATVQLTVIPVHGTRFTVDVPSTNTVAQLKSVISVIQSVAVEQQRLVYRGRMLLDAEVLDALGLSDGQCVHLVVRPAAPPGPPPPPPIVAVDAQSRQARGIHVAQPVAGAAMYAGHPHVLPLPSLLATAQASRWYSAAHMWAVVMLCVFSFEIIFSLLGDVLTFFVNLFGLVVAIQGVRALRSLNLPMLRTYVRALALVSSLKVALNIVMMIRILNDAPADRTRALALAGVISIVLFVFMAVSAVRTTTRFLVDATAAETAVVANIDAALRRAAPAGVPAPMNAV